MSNIGPSCIYLNTITLVSITSLHIYLVQLLEIDKSTIFCQRFSTPGSTFTRTTRLCSRLLIFCIPYLFALFIAAVNTNVYYSLAPVLKHIRVDYFRLCRPYVRNMTLFTWRNYFFIFLISAVHTPVVYPIDRILTTQTYRYLCVNVFSHHVTINSFSYRCLPTINSV